MTKTPELPAVVAKIVADAKTADKAQAKQIAVKVVTERNPSALTAVLASVDALPAEKRPPVTPGNENGNRPTVPPGLDKRDYGSP